MLAVMINAETRLFFCETTDYISNLGPLLPHKSENRLDNLVDNLIKILLLDASKPTSHIAFDIARDDLALDDTRLREGEAHNHIVG